MARILDNPDRNFSADPVDKSEAELLRRLESGKAGAVPV
jgi:hypothetical protein